MFKYNNKNWSLIEYLPRLEQIPGLQSHIYTEIEHICFGGENYAILYIKILCSKYDFTVSI